VATYTHAFCEHVVKAGRRNSISLSNFPNFKNKIRLVRLPCSLLVNLKALINQYENLVYITWHVDPLLVNGCLISNYTTVLTRQRPLNSKRGTVFSARSVPMSAHQKFQSDLLPLNIICAAVEERRLLCGPFQNCFKRGQLVCS
jgi:hypothetical protein